MKIRQGFVSNSSTSSYIYLIAEMKNVSEDAIKSIKEMGFLVRESQNPKKMYFGRQIYEGYDDSFYFTDFEKVESNKKAYLDIYNKYKEEYGLGDIKYANDVAYDEHWLIEGRFYDEMMAEQEYEDGDDETEDEED